MLNAAGGLVAVCRIGDSRRACLRGIGRGLESGPAIGADAVGEFGMRMLRDIGLDPFPIAMVVSNLLAPRAHRKEATQRLHIRQGFLQGGYEVFAFGLLADPFGDVAEDEDAARHATLLVEDGCPRVFNLPTDPIS